MEIELHHKLGLLESSHVSNVPSPLKNLLQFLSSLLFDTDCPSERGIRDDSSQRRRNPRIKHLKIREKTFLQLTATSKDRLQISPSQLH